jgi:hypothetical protein
MLKEGAAVSTNTSSTSMRGLTPPGRPTRFAVSKTDAIPEFTEQRGFRLIIVTPGRNHWDGMKRL